MNPKPPPVNRGTLRYSGPNVGAAEYADFQNAQDGFNQSSADLLDAMDVAWTAAPSSGADPSLATVTVGPEGARGLWGVAASLAGPGASNADIKQVQLQLETANPGVSVLHQGDSLNLGDGSVTSQARQQDAGLNASYQADLARRNAVANATALPDWLYPNSNGTGGASGRWGAGASGSWTEDGLLQHATFGSELRDTGRAVVNAGIDVVEGVPNLLSGALPGFPDYVPFMQNVRLPYETPLFGTAVELLTGIGIAKAASLWGATRSSPALTPEYLPGYSEGDILSLPKGSRPPASDYLTPAYQDAHAALFEGGVARIQPSAPTGTIGRTETWVLPKSVADDTIAQAGGDISKLEQLLGYDPGYLGSSPVRVDIPSPSGYRIPTGNEFGANTFWRPGGLTRPGGLPEATIDPVPVGSYVANSIYP